MRLIFQRAEQVWGAPGDGTPAPRPGCCGRVHGAGGGSCQLVWGGRWPRALPGKGPENAGRGSPGERRLLFPLPRCRCSWCLGLPPAPGDASLGRLLVPPPGCADSWDATSLGSWDSELIPLGLDPGALGLSYGGNIPRDLLGVEGARGERLLQPGRLREKARGRERARRAGGRDTLYL